ncbi:MAG TPA: excinuclease ABC subunit UvrC [Blastocatellia bacterium]|nr:excinuclease ABC subunit UvrC [Blastocatellia bacterium]
MTIEEKLQILPAMPGCYLHKDQRGKIIYIGKAKSLRNRVRSYFQSSRALDAKTRELVARIVDFDYIVTDTEAEALILESNLVKRYQPRYNVLLKDDKQYPRIKITNEPFPRAVLVRRLANDGAHYYGPFLPASIAYQTLELINKYFMLRTCQIEIDGKLDRPCLEYHIKRCLGPCVRGLCTKEEYDEAVTDVLALLDGKSAQLEQSLNDRMERASVDLRFEMAAKYRDQLRTIERLAEQQKMMRMSEADIDIFGLYREGAQLALILFTMREGRVVGKREYFFEDIVEPFDTGVFLGEALAQYYAGSDYAPGEVHVPADFEDRELLETVLGAKRKRRVRIRTPKRGNARGLVELVTKNARLKFDQRFRVRRIDGGKLVLELQDLLELPEPPRRIECFDISHIQGEETVASMVVCIDGEMARSEYRKFKVRTVEGIDDYASMFEVIHRRYSRLLAEKKKWPELVMIDGGKGQLRAGARALHELELEAVPAVALAKREETLYLKGHEDEPINLPKHSPLLHLVQRIRDESHRFAVTYHRKRRALRDKHSVLDEIPNVGPRRKEILLRNFGSLERVSKASVAELKPFVGLRTAESIVEHFAGSPGPSGPVSLPEVPGSGDHGRASQRNVTKRRKF